MGRPERVLFAALLRAARRFERQGLPLTGVAGTRHALWGLAPAAALAAAFRAPPGPGASSFEEGALLLSRLEAQGAALAAAEEETRAALGEWAALARAWGAAGAGARGAGAAVAEAGLALLSAQARAAADPLGLDDDGGASDEGEGGGVAPSLDGLAAAARARHPAAFPPLKNGALFPADAPAEAQAERLQALSDSLFKGPERLRCEPFEWVYEGLSPLLLPDCLAARRAAPAAAAVAAAAVGARLGLPLLPLPAEAAPAGLAGPRAAAPAGLPPALALRVAAQPLAPGPGPWLLRLDAPGEALFLDAGDGAVMTSAAAAARHPLVAHLSLDEWRARAPLGAWQGLVRVLLQAHQRRGESDLVARWTYVALALDPDAPEWPAVLAGSELG